MGSKTDERERTYHWFVEPLDATTNAALARELPEEDALRDVHDDQGESHNVYRVGSKTLSFLRNSKSQSGLKFRIYVKEGHGKMRFASFLPSRSKKAKTDLRKEAAAWILSSLYPRYRGGRLICQWDALFLSDIFLSL